MTKVLVAEKIGASGIDLLKQHFDVTTSFDQDGFDLEARIGEKFPGMLAVGRKAATGEAAAATGSAPDESADTADGASGAGCSDACAKGAAASEIPISDQAKAA